MPKDKFFVYFYNDSNLGDDLLLDTLVRRFQQFDFYIYADKRTPQLNKTFRQYDNLHYAANNFSIKNVKTEIEKYAGVILIGGSIFQDLNYVLYRGYIGRYLIFKKLIQSKKKVFIIGANIGPFKTLFGKLIFKHIFKYVTHVCVRDSYSFQLLDEWGVVNKDLAPDVVFGYDFQSKCKTSPSKNILGISILNTKLNPEVRGVYIRKMAELTNIYLNGSPDRLVRFFGFDGGNENDGEIIDEVIKLVVFPRQVVKIEYNEKITISEYLDLFVECGFIVANRFHSMVLAAKYKIPFYPIVYSKKSSNVLSDLGYHSDSTEYAEIDKLDLNKLLIKILGGGNIFSIPDSVCIESAKHFSGLESYRYCD